MLHRIAGALAVVLLVPPAGAMAAERRVTLDPTASEISFTLEATLHEVRGTLPLVRGEIVFDPASGKAAGEIAVDARGASTGNRRRDAKMRETVLETVRYPLIVFRAERIEGTLAASGPSDLRLVGTMEIHGAAHPVTLPARVEIGRDRVRATTEFAVPYVEWGLSDPSVLFLRVAKTVTVAVRAEGRVSPAE